ncbi:GntR family transcriptional regulator [Micromonospora sp. CB01531]|uniref:GntR family transcriptional regulator n=1 Tax=Micromonospora sp. CB01531 TaxID=1718947 RepID=UPI00093F9182|nr:GntR family transcriptional regulator [Micromonospora sp. CB01531]OKI47449.1 hypothetical protein A6A27_10780 [Micromonospora sp. CB01531]
MPIPMGYRRIAEDLRTRIAAGEYQAGTRLPTYRELAEMYSAGVSTIQKAVLLLQAEGVVVGVQGAGLYVAEERPEA